MKSGSRLETPAPAFYVGMLECWHFREHPVMVEGAGKGKRAGNVRHDRGRDAEREGRRY